MSFLVLLTFLRPKAHQNINTLALNKVPSAVHIIWRCYPFTATKSSVVQEECRATSPLFVLRLHLSHAIAVGLHVHVTDIEILTPEKVGSFGV